MTAAQERVPLSRPGGRSAASGAAATNSPSASLHRANSPRVRAAFLPQSAGRPSHVPSVGNAVWKDECIVAGRHDGVARTRAPNFFLSDPQLGGEVTQDTADVLPRFGLHDRQHGALDVPYQRNVFTFAENEDGRRT